MLNKYSNMNVYIDEKTFNKYFENPIVMQEVTTWSGLSCCYLIVQNETSAQNLKCDKSVISTDLRVRAVIAKNLNNMTYYTPVILTK